MSAILLRDEFPISEIQKLDDALVEINEEITKLKLVRTNLEDDYIKSVTRHIMISSEFEGWKDVEYSQVVKQGYNPIVTTDEEISLNDSGSLHGLSVFSLLRL